MFYFVTEQTDYNVTSEHINFYWKKQNEYVVLGCVWTCRYKIKVLISYPKIIEQGVKTLFTLVKDISWLPWKKERKLVVLQF